MIIRSFRGTVAAGREEEFYSLVRERVARFRERFALIDSHVSLRTTPGGDRCLVTTHWPSWEALRTWSQGEDLEQPWGFSELVPLLESWEIEHFEEIETGDD